MKDTEKEFKSFLKEISPLVMVLSSYEMDEVIECYVPSDIAYIEIGRIVNKYHYHEFCSFSKCFKIVDTKIPMVFSERFVIDDDISDIEICGIKFKQVNSVI